MIILSLLCCVFASFTIVDSVDIGDFCTGIAFADGYVWAIDNDVWTQGNIYKIDPSNMSIVEVFGYNPGLYKGCDGLAFDGEYFWLGVFPDEIHKINRSWSRVGSWSSPGPYSMGMAFDGIHLWHSDHDSLSIFKLTYPDPSQVLDSWYLVVQLGDLAWYDGHLFAAVNNYYVNEYDPVDLSLISSTPTGRNYTVGLAIGGGYLWFGTGNWSGMVYKVDIGVGVGEDRRARNDTSSSIIAFPNPFKHVTRLKIPWLSETEINYLYLYDASGRRVRSFALEPGNSQRAIEICWDGCDDSEKKLPAGVYYCKFSSGSTAVSTKILLMR